MIMENILINQNNNKKIGIIIYLTNINYILYLIIIKKN